MTRNNKKESRAQYWFYSPMAYNRIPIGPSFPYDANRILKSDATLSATSSSVSVIPLNTIPPPSRYVRRPRLHLFDFDKGGPLDPSGPIEEA